MNAFSEDMVVVTSTYVVNDHLPILMVSHEDDEEGGSLWQFHAGNGDYDMSKMLLVSIENIRALEPEIDVLADLPFGHTAVRETKSATWRYLAG